MDREKEKLKAALRTLLRACERYDEDPTDLAIAVYTSAKECARVILNEGGKS